MNLASIETIQFLCKKYKFLPSPKSGQHFLISESSLSKIIQAAEPQKDDTVLEIGAGFGTLTVELLQRVKKVIAVELDKRMISALKRLAAVNKSLTLIKGDIFEQWPIISPRLVDYQYKLVANLPYNITSLVLRNFLEQKPRPSQMTLLVQREVAERVVAKPGKMSLLSVAVQFFGNPEIISFIPSRHFWPQPEVNSAILRIQGIGQDVGGYKKLLRGVELSRFFILVKTGFSAKRKQLHNNFAAGLRINNKKAREILIASGIDPISRAQNLSIEQWIKIAHNVIKEEKKII